jgi:hypothetical protein
MTAIPPGGSRSYQEKHFRVGSLVGQIKLAWAWALRFENSCRSSCFQTCTNHGLFHILVKVCTRLYPEGTCVSQCSEWYEHSLFSIQNRIYFLLSTYTTHYWHVIMMYNMRAYIYIYIYIYIHACMQTADVYMLLHLRYQHAYIHTYMHAHHIATRPENTYLLF